MINILSIRCSLAFAPYLDVSAAEFALGGTTASRVVRQGGRGLIVRTDGDLVLRHEQRQAYLGEEDARHYSATVQFRSDAYDILRMQDEIVLANAGEELFLSHPQSEIWLNRDAIAGLVSAFTSRSLANVDQERAGFPEWLKVSTGADRLLLSDQRTARWVLLGGDHLRELERRLGSLRSAGPVAAEAVPPTISLKGLTVHLQSAFKLAETLREFANTGKVAPFEEVTPIYSLRASASTEGIELRDSNMRAGLTAREAAKWANIISAELDRLKVRWFERGRIRTIFADNGEGRWILQWGDEVFLPHGVRPLATPGGIESAASGAPTAKRIGEFLLLLRRATGACVALTESEARHLGDPG